MAAPSWWLQHPASKARVEMRACEGVCAGPGDGVRSVYGDRLGLLRPSLSPNRGRACSRSETNPQLGWRWRGSLLDSFRLVYQQHTAPLAEVFVAWPEALQIVTFPDPAREEWFLGLADCRDQRRRRLLKASSPNETREGSGCSVGSRGTANSTSKTSSYAPNMVRIPKSLDIGQCWYSGGALLACAGSLSPFSEDNEGSIPRASSRDGCPSPTLDAPVLSWAVGRGRLWSIDCQPSFDTEGRNASWTQT
ncbi:hypothetical protein CC79DRAFT_1107119 [Sarocladium strictum]